MITLSTSDASAGAERAEPALNSTTRLKAQDIISGPHNWLNRFEWLAVVLVALCAIALHVQFVTHVGGLWRDEANSVNLATLPSFAEMWRVLDYDSFPMLFFAVLRGWTAMFGANDDLALRALGLITGLGILGALWASARSFGIKWPVLSFALIGLNPMLVRYGDSTRAYGLGIILILLTLRSFWRLVDSPGPPTTRRIAMATLLALLSVQCLYYNSVLLLAIAAGAMAVAIRARAWRTLGIVLGIGMLAAASLLPYIPMMRRMRAWTFLVSYPEGGFAWLWTRICEVLGSPSPLGVWLWPALVIVGLALAAGVWATGRRKLETSSRSISAAVLFAAVTLAVGVAGYAGFLRVLNYWTQPWYYITLTAFAACVLEVLFGAWPAASKPRIALRVVRLAVALLLLGVAVGPAWEEVPTRHTNMDLIAVRLQQLTAKEDVIVVLPWECAIPLCRYYRGPAEVMTLPPISEHRFHRYDLVLRQMMTANPLSPVLARMENVLRSGHRIFLVGYLRGGGSLRNILAFPKPDQVPLILPPAYQDAGGHWHGGYRAVWQLLADYRTSWQLQIGHFLRVSATGAVRIDIPVPENAHVQEYEEMELVVVQGWKQTPAVP
jgi:hypothetical protein